MADRHVASASPNRRPAAPSAWYAAAVVGLAVFVGGLLVSHPPITGYRVQATVIRSVAAVETRAEPVNFAAAEEWLRSDETLRAIARPTDDRNHVLQPVKALSTTEAAALRNQLRLESSELSPQQQWTIHYVGHNRQQARTIAERAAHELAAYLDRVCDKRPGVAEIAALRSELDASQAKESRLRDELTQIRHESLAAALSHERKELAEQFAFMESLDSQAPAAQRRLAISQKIDELRIEFRTLAATRLANHPSVAAVLSQIEQLETQLRELPEPKSALSNPHDSSWQGPGAIGSPRVTEATFTSIRSTDEPEFVPIQSRLEEVRAELHMAIEQRSAAERRLDAAVQLSSTAWQKQWLATDARPAKRLGGSPGTRDLLWAGILGIVAATSITIDWSQLRRMRVLQTAHQARNTLPAPLLGEIPLPASRPVSRARTGARLRIVRMAEWMLIVSLFLLILAAVSQRELAAQLASDPFGAMAEAFDTVRGIPW